MLEFFLSKVKGIFATPADTKVSKKAPVTAKAVVTSTPVSTEENTEKNRVVFSPKKEVAPVQTVVLPVVEVKPSAKDLAAIVAKEKEILENARRIEQEAKRKESEIFQRLSSLDEKEKYLIQKEKNIDAQTAEVKTKLTQLDDIYKKQLEKLEQISGLDVEKAKQLILSSTEKRMASWISKKISEAKEELKQKEDELATQFLPFLFLMKKLKARLSVEKAEIFVLLKKPLVLN